MIFSRDLPPFGSCLATSAPKTSLTFLSKDNSNANGSLLSSEELILNADEVITLCFTVKT